MATKYNDWRDHANAFHPNRRSLTRKHAVAIKGGEHELHTSYEVNGVWGVRSSRRANTYGARAQYVYYLTHLPSGYRCPWPTGREPRNRDEVRAVLADLPQVGGHWAWATDPPVDDDYHTLEAALFPYRATSKPADDEDDEPYPGADKVLARYGLHDYPVPTLRDVQGWLYDGVVPTPGCECDVEPDGRCEHGRPSWLRALGLV